MVNYLFVLLYSFSGNLLIGIFFINLVFSKFSNSCMGLGMVFKNFK